METTVIVVAVGLAVAVGLVVRRRLGSMTMVDSDSMVPTLSPGNLLLSRRLRGSRSVRRGDVVVVRSAELGRMIVKRTVGLPGEHLEVAAGEVLVNGKRLLEPYVTRRGGLAGSFDVPDGHVLLLGDSRAQSSDSRSWRQPYLPIAALSETVLPRRGQPTAAPPDRVPQSVAVSRGRSPATDDESRGSVSRTWRPPAPLRLRCASARALQWRPKTGDGLSGACRRRSGSRAAVQTSGTPRSGLG